MYTHLIVDNSLCCHGYACILDIKKKLHSSWRSTHKHTLTWEASPWSDGSHQLLSWGEAPQSGHDLSCLQYTMLSCHPVHVRRSKIDQSHELPYHPPTYTVQHHTSMTIVKPRQKVIHLLQSCPNIITQDNSYFHPLVNTRQMCFHHEINTVKPPLSALLTGTSFYLGLYLRLHKINFLFLVSCTCWSLVCILLASPRMLSVYFLLEQLGLRHHIFCYTCHFSSFAGPQTGN